MHTSDTSTNDNNNNAFHVFHGTSTMIVVSYNWIVKKKHKSFEIAMSILSYRDCRVISLHLTLLVEDINHDNDEKTISHDRSHEPRTNIQHGQHENTFPTWNGATNRQLDDLAQGWPRFPSSTYPRSRHRHRSTMRHRKLQTWHSYHRLIRYTYI